MSLPKDFLEQLPLKTDSELYDMLAHQDDYLPQATAAAKDELSKRNLSLERLAQIETTVQFQNAAVETKAQEPLGRTMLNRKVITTFCLSFVFWLMITCGVAWRDNANSRAAYASAGLVAAVLLVLLGLVLLRIGSMAGKVAGNVTGNANEATKEATRFALIILVTGITCGLIALGFFL
jgi:hypothetical protein